MDQYRQVYHLRPWSIPGGILLLISMHVNLYGLARIQRLHDPEADLDEKMQLLLAEAETSDFIRIGVSDLEENLYLSDSYGIVGSVVDISQREYCRESLDGNQAVMTPSVSVNPDDGGNLIMVYSVPLEFNGRITGVLVAMGDGNFLSGIVQEMEEKKETIIRVIENLSTISEENANTSEELAKLAQEMQAAVSRFKL